MPDITMCCNFECPLKSKCYRYRAVPDTDRQSFALFKPQERMFGKYDDKIIDCEYFWQVDEMHDKTLATSIVDNRYERDGKWRGLK